MIVLPLRRPSSSHSSRTGAAGNISRFVSSVTMARSSSVSGSACAAFSTARHVDHVSPENAEPSTTVIKRMTSPIGALLATHHLGQRRDLPLTAFEPDGLSKRDRRSTVIR